MFLGSLGNNLLAGGNNLGGTIDEGGLAGSLSWANPAAWGDGEFYAGVIVQPGTPVEDLSFFYSNDGLNFSEGDVVPGVPEPSSFLLMALGCMLAHLRRQRRQR